MSVSRRVAEEMDVELGQQVSCASVRIWARMCMMIRLSTAPQRAASDMIRYFSCIPRLFTFGSFC
jgi:hypothetical protein